VNNVNVFAYRSAKRFFLDSVEEEKRSNTFFSVRKWAKEMGMPGHALLILILQGKRNLTLKQVPFLAKGLRLSTPERLYFQTLIQLENTKTNEEKELIRSWLMDLNPGTHYQVKEVDEYLVISHWIHMAILAYAFSKQGLTQVDQLIQRFESKLSALEIHVAFERLKDLGFLIWSDEEKKFQAKYQRLTTKDDVANRGAREYHKQVAQLSIDSIEKQKPEDREFQSFAINVPTHKIKTLKEMMRKFRTQIENELNDGAELIAAGDDELYQMNLHFFRLTDKPWSCSTVQTDIGARQTHSNELAMEDNRKESNEIVNE
jgi:uncharacterized protein (TIGR02147 family)